MILEEGNRPYPRCPKRDMFVSHKALISWLLAKAFFHRGGGKEVAPPGGGGDTGGGRYGDHSIWDPPCPVHLLQLPWYNLLGVVRRLARYGTQTLAGTKEVGADIYVVDQVG